MKLQLCHEDFELLPEKALYWPRKKILALSDIHLGKAESYQAAGVPVPSGAHREDLYQLQNLLNLRPAEKILILGDLIHNIHSWTTEVKKDLQNFLTSFQDIQWHLIYGNHERGSLRHLQNLPLTFSNESLTLEGFQWCHGHEETSSNPSGVFKIQGHIHPQVLLKDGPVSLRLPCFHLTKDSLTLPAFGSLTGGYVIKPSKKDRLFAIAGPEVLEIKC